MMRVIAALLVVYSAVAGAGLASPAAAESAIPQLAVPDQRPAGTPALNKSATTLGFYTFDQGGSPDPQGWTKIDRTVNSRAFIHVDDFLTPLAGTKSLWCGAEIDANDPETADWLSAGYANNWRQYWVSREFTLPTADPTTLSYQISWELDNGPDTISVEYRVDGGTWQTALAYSTPSGSATDSVTAPSAGTIQFRFRFDSNGSYSNSDGLVGPIGAFLLDEVEVKNGATDVLSYENFETEPIGATATNSGDWSAEVGPGFGLYAGLSGGQQVRQDDAATYNATNFWTFFEGSTDQYLCSNPQTAVPIGGAIYLQRIDNEIRSPWLDLDLNINPNSVRVDYDVYLDSPFSPTPPVDHSVYYSVTVAFRNASGDLLDAKSTGLWYGLNQSWIALHHQYNLPVGATQIQVSFRVRETYNSPCHRHAPLFDNVQVSQTTAYTVRTNAEVGTYSLSQAITWANNNPGPDRIDFYIEDNQPGIRSFPLPQITETLHIAGFTQPGARPNTLSGASDALLAVQLIGSDTFSEPGLDIRADGCLIEGLAIRGYYGESIRIQSDQNVVRGCWLGVPADGIPGDESPGTLLQLTNTYGNQIGGPLPADQNVVGNCQDIAISANNTDHLLVQGNLVGLGPDGQTAASTSTGVYIYRSEQSLILDNVVSGNTRGVASSGIAIHEGTDIVVQGNIIGLSGDQTTSVPNSYAGIHFNGSQTDVTIGGCEPGQGNIISGNGGPGIVLNGSGQVTILGNTIGTNASEVPTLLGNTEQGILAILTEGDLFVGDGNCGNLIAHNGGAGIEQHSDESGTYEWRANRIHDNGGLEIDLTSWSGSQTIPPVISQATLATDVLSVSGQITGAPGYLYVVDLFASRQCEDPDDPQAELYLGSNYLTLGPTGYAAFSFIATGAFLPDDLVTAVATSPQTGSSAISTCTPAINTPVGPDVLVYLPDPTGTEYPVTIEFEEVTAPGITSAQPGCGVASVPDSLQVFGMYTIATSATWSSGVQLCFDYDYLGVPTGAESSLQVLQFDPWDQATPWSDITTQLVPSAGLICGGTTWLAPAGYGCFAVVVPAGLSDVPSPPSALTLLPNAPNPFNPSTRIRFDLPRDSERVTVDIYDLAGRHVRRIFAGPAAAGLQTLDWNGKDDAGRQVVSGVYPLRLVNGKEVRTQRLVLLK